MSRRKPKLLIAASFFQTTRILLNTSILERLCKTVDPVIWTSVATEGNFPSDHPHAKRFKPYPSRDSLSGTGGLLRQLDSYAWDWKRLSRTRESHWRLRRRKSATLLTRFLRRSAWPIHALGLHAPVERGLAWWIVRFGTTSDVRRALEAERPDAVLMMNPFPSDMLGMAAAAKQLSLPVLAYFASWDNITTKQRFMLSYDAYIVWSESMRRELEEFYPQAKGRPVHVVGAPYADLFQRDEYHETRATFLASYGLDADRPVVAYCLGSPNLIREEFGAIEFVKRLRAKPEYHGVQVIIRLHPGFSSYTEVERELSAYGGVVVQNPARKWATPVEGHAELSEWINTMRHADVVINLSSTITVDAAICDTPIVNLDFDPEPGGPNDQMVKEINRRWNHFAPIVATKGLSLVRSYEEMLTAVAAYLANPTLHREGRAKIVERVCQHSDGQSAARFADSLLGLLEPLASSSSARLDATTQGEAAASLAARPS